jgi:nitroreductase
MIRDYDPDRPVSAEIIDRLLDYAVRAPSAGFTQGWKFLLLAAESERAAFWAAAAPQRAGQGSAWLVGMRRAPLIVVPHACREAYLDRYAEPDKGWTDRDEARWPVPYWDIDAGFASMLMLLGVVDQGLGACFFGIPPERVDAYRSAFDVPDDHHPIGAITIGYGAPDRRSPSLARGRRGPSEVTYAGRWGRPYPNGVRNPI